MITLRSIISPCQKATVLILIPLYNTSFDFWNHQKHLWALPYFCLGCLLKSATVTSLSQLHLSRNSGPGRSLEQINLHSVALYTRWLIEEAKKMWATFESFFRNGKFTFREMHNFGFSRLWTLLIAILMLVYNKIFLEK